MFIFFWYFHSVNVYSTKCSIQAVHAAVYKIFSARKIVVIGGCLLLDTI